MNKLKFALIVVGGLIVLGAVLLFITRPKDAPVGSADPVTLEWWSVFEDEATVKPLIEEYRKLHPFVRINYRRLRFDEYEDLLLNALAENRGPDIFSFHNTWGTRYQSKLLPLPRQMTTAIQYQTTGIKKEIVTELRTTRGVTPRDVQNIFLDVVYDDVVRPEVVVRDEAPVDMVFGLPLGADSLALYYNRDLLNNAGIPQPPAFWSDVQDNAQRLTKLDANGNIVQSGISIGSSKNVVRYLDILSVLMMQNGAQMTDDFGNVIFNTVPGSLRGRQTPPGVEALTFYTDFANPSKAVYSWDDKQPNSLESFIAGKSAMFLGYSFHLDSIHTQAPKMNLGIAKLPQISGNPEINYANYWIEGVSRQTRAPDIAWEFVQFMTTSSDLVAQHLEASKKPAALRGLISDQLEDEDLSVFVSQLLTTKSWYKGKNPNAVEQIFADLIDSVVNGLQKPKDALDLAAQKVQQTL